MFVFVYLIVLIDKLRPLLVHQSDVDMHEVVTAPVLGAQEVLGHRTGGWGVRALGHAETANVHMRVLTLAINRVATKNNFALKMTTKILKMTISLR